MTTTPAARHRRTSRKLAIVVELLRGAILLGFVFVPIAIGLSAPFRG